MHSSSERWCNSAFLKCYFVYNVLLCKLGACQHLEFVRIFEYALKLNFRRFCFVWVEVCIQFYRKTGAFYLILFSIDNYNENTRKHQHTPPNTMFWSVSLKQMFTRAIKTKSDRLSDRISFFIVYSLIDSIDR